MQHELSIINHHGDDIWADFGYDKAGALHMTRELGRSMIEQLRRDDITTKTQAFKEAIEQDGERIGLKLDTVNDYFFLGAVFTTTALAMQKTENQLRRGWVKLPLNLGAAICAGVSATQLLTGDRNWIGYACMAVLLFVLKTQLTRTTLD